MYDVREIKNPIAALDRVLKMEDGKRSGPHNNITRSMDRLMLRLKRSEYLHKKNGRNNQGKNKSSQDLCACMLHKCKTILLKTKKRRRFSSSTLFVGSTETGVYRKYNYFSTTSNFPRIKLFLIGFSRGSSVSYAWLTR